MLENCAILRQRADRAGAVQRKKTPLYNIAAAKPPGTDAGGKNVPYTFTNIHQHPSISETRLAAVCSTKRSSGIPFRKGSLPPSLSTHPAPTLHADSLLAYPTLQHILLYIYTYFYITPFCLYNAILCCTYHRPQNTPSMSTFTMGRAPRPNLEHTSPVVRLHLISSGNDEDGFDKPQEVFGGPVQASFSATSDGWRQ